MTSRLDELIGRGDRDELELVRGEIVARVIPSPAHNFVAARLPGLVDAFNRRPAAGCPGGWWLFVSIHVAYTNGELYCHDAAGWRRDRVPVRPTEWPVRVRPDWVCEIESPKHRRRDELDKPQVLHAAEVPHYWLINPEEQILLIHRWSPDGYVIVQRATAGEIIRAEPFGAIELRLSELFGVEDEPE